MIFIPILTNDGPISYEDNNERFYIKIWTKCFYNHAISDGIDYIMVNLTAGRDGKVLDKDAGGRIRSKLKEKLPTAKLRRRS